ncbi:MAG TPA: S8 family serine peptidase [Gemmata sp.]
MAFSRAGRVSLGVEHLEDRTTPTVIGSGPPTMQVGSDLFAADRVTVLMNPGVSGSGLGAAPFAQSVKHVGFGIYSVRVAPGTDLNAAIAYFGTQPGVETAELDPIVQLERKPNDPSYNQPSFYGPSQIGAEAVWNSFTGNPGFVVGVIDSGIDYTHPDLAANIWTNPNEIPGNGVDDDGNGYIDDIHGWDFANDDNDPMDVDGHGTHVAGTIGAIGNNGVGVAGINWNVKLMALDYLGPGANSGVLSTGIEALNYSIMMGVKLTNNSYGGTSHTQARARALAGAQAAGQIFVVAAGNDGENNDVFPHYPTNYSRNYDNVIAVAATDSNDQLADFSDYGFGTVTLAAPGVQILSTVPLVADTADGIVDGYDTYDGTSMATPHVTGAIALYWGANPTLTYQQVVNKLKSSVDVLPQLNGFVSTGGRLNVAKMFNAPTVPPITVGAPVGTELVRVLGTGGTSVMTIDPYPGFLGGVESAVGDVNNDGTPDMVTAATLGGHVKVFDGATGALVNSFLGFQGYQGPINLAVGDLNNDGFADLVVAANLNGHIKVFDGKTGALTFSSLVYQGYRGAISVAVADRDGDGRLDLLTAADGGAGVHVKTFQNGAGGALIESFLATGAGSWRGFSMAAADLDLDGVPELLISQGPRVRVIDGKTRAIKADFIAFDPLSNDPAKLQAARYTGDPSPEVVLVRETAGQPAQVRVYDGRDFSLTDAFVAGTR